MPNSICLLFADSTTDNASLILSDDMQALEVFIEFSAIANKDSMTSYWCDSIEVFIIYGTYLEFSRGIYATSQILPQKISC